MTWQVHHDGKVREWSEAKLRKKLASGDLSGIELVQPPGSDEWRPLHSLPVFAEVVPHSGDVMPVVRKRIIRSFTGHLAIFVILFAVFNLVGIPTFWMPFWGIGLALHAYQTYQKLDDLADASQPVARSTAAESAATPYPLSVDSDLLTALEQLGDALPDAERLRQTATELAQRRAVAEDAADPDSIAALHHERNSVLSQAESADDTTRAALEDQAAALDARIGFLESVQQMATRLRAQERTLLHQVEAVRLGQLQQQPASEVSDLTSAVDRLRRELDADAEVSDALARARRSQRT